MEKATWIMAITTIIYSLTAIVYTIVSIIMLRSNTKTVSMSEEAFKLNILITLIGLHRPVWGTNNKVHTADSKSYEALRKIISEDFKDSMKTNFPKRSEKILKILDERYVDDE